MAKTSKSFLHGFSRLFAHSVFIDLYLLIKNTHARVKSAREREKRNFELKLCVFSLALTVASFNEKIFAQLYNYFVVSFICSGLQAKTTFVRRAFITLDDVFIM